MFFFFVWYWHWSDKRSAGAFIGLIRQYKRHSFNFVQLVILAQFNHQLFCILKWSLKMQNIPQKVFQIKYKILFNKRHSNKKWVLCICILNRSISNKCHLCSQCYKWWQQLINTSTCVPHNNNSLFWNNKRWSLRHSHCGYTIYFLN